MNKCISVISTSEFTLSPSWDHAASRIYLCYRSNLLSAFSFS